MEIIKLIKKLSYHTMLSFYIKIPHPPSLTAQLIKSHIHLTYLTHLRVTLLLDGATCAAYITLKKSVKLLFIS